MNETELSRVMEPRQLKKQIQGSEIHLIVPFFYRHVRTLLSNGP